MMVTLLVFLVDAVLVTVFATFGRGAHSEGLGVAQVWGTAWPFLIGLVAGWAVLLLTRRSTTVVPSGVVLWLTTLIGGMAIRGLAEGRVPHWSFMVVAGVTTAAFLIGWRAAYGLARSRSRRRGSPAPAPAVGAS